MTGLGVPQLVAIRLPLAALIDEDCVLAPGATIRLPEKLNVRSPERLAAVMHVRSYRVDGDSILVEGHFEFHVKHREDEHGEEAPSRPAQG